MTASVEIITTRKSGVLSVPLAAVTTRGEEKDKKNEQNQGGPPQNQDHVVTSNKKQEKKEDKVVVFINDKGVAKMVEVKTGISDYDNIEIVSGISDSSEVVVGPFLVVSKRLKEGDKITATKKKDEKKDDKPEGE
jgi:HlyD family secretion protein